jgi:hypothetical protein
VPEYEREFTRPLDRRTRLRTGFSTSRGTPTKFVVQLEYRVDGEWMQVARFDHDPDAENGHDVRSEGLHLDIYENGRKVTVDRDFPAVSLKRALPYCEMYLKRHVTEHVRSFEQALERDETRNP